MKRENAYDRAAEIIAALMHGPRTRADLLDYLGMHPSNLTPLSNQLNAYRASGVIYRSGVTLHGAEILSLQPKPFEHVDYESPKWLTRGRGGPTRMVMLADGRNVSVHEAKQLTGWCLKTLYKYSNRGSRVPTKKQK